MTPDELKSLPKGTFVVTKTGAYPMQVKLKLFFEWGIVFTDELYDVPDKGNRIVAYARKEDLQKKDGGNLSVEKRGTKRNCRSGENCPAEKKRAVPETATEWKTE